MDKRTQDTLIVVSLIASAAGCVFSGHEDASARFIFMLFLYMVFG